MNSMESMLQEKSQENQSLKSQIDTMSLQHILILTQLVQQGQLLNQKFNGTKPQEAQLDLKALVMPQTLIPGLN